MISRKIFSLVLFFCLFQALQATNVTITTGKDTVCTGADVKFKGAAAGGTITKYQWVTDSIRGVTILPNDSSQTVTINFANPGTYTVTMYVTFSPSGVDSSKRIITVIQSATALFGVSGMTAGVPQSVSFTNASINAPKGFVWNFGDNGGTSIKTNPSHVFTSAAAYTVTLIAYGNYGCNDTVSSPLIIADTAGLTMPNVFTPNGDGINDVFAPNAHSLKTLDCTIYDRYGVKVIDMDINLQYWDGYTTSGIACTAGTYFYVLSATDVNGKSYSLKGFIQLIR